MTVENTKGLLDDIKKSMFKLGVETPKQLSSFKAFAEECLMEGKLGLKHKELVAVALSVSKQCSWCIAHHVEKALAAGAIKEEIIEAAWVAVVMNGGPSLMYLQFVLNALEEK